MPTPSITAEEARQLLDYDAETGALTWRVGRKRARAGNVAGTPHSKGYIQIRIYGKPYLAHRLAWLITHGAWPENQIDHINGERDDNRLVNLRPATPAENLRNAKRQRNNTSGFKGVSWHKPSKRWQAQIAVNGRTIHVGCFSTPEEAHAAYCKAAEKLHGEFANFG